MKSILGWIGTGILVAIWVCLSLWYRFWYLTIPIGMLMLIVILCLLG